MATIREKAEEILNEKNRKVLPENIKSGVTVFNVAGTLQELVGETTTVTPTTEQQVITPSEGKTGITEITVAPVDNTIDTNIVAENIKKDVSILGVVGTLEAGGGSVEGVRQFASISELNATVGSKGDLAVIYVSSIDNMTFGMEAQTISFPEMVELPETVVDFLYTSLRPVDETVMCDVTLELSVDRFAVSVYTERGSQQIEYTSEDGAVFTRITDVDTLDLGTSVKCYYEEEWNDFFGYFLQINNSTFEGMYEYTGSTWEIAPSQLTLTHPGQLLPGTIGYGSNGLIEGDDTVYDNLDYKLMNEKFGIEQYLFVDSNDEIPNGTLFVTPAIMSEAVYNVTVETTRSSRNKSRCSRIQ